MFVLLPLFLLLPFFCVSLGKIYIPISKNRSNTLIKVHSPARKLSLMFFNTLTKSKDISTLAASSSSIGLALEDYDFVLVYGAVNFLVSSF